MGLKIIAERLRALCDDRPSLRIEKAATAGSRVTIRFNLLSDDGVKLKLNKKVVINNDGVHTAMTVSGGATLTRGVHEIKVEYFQGPRFTVALAGFKPPKDPHRPYKGRISEVQRQT